VEDLDIIVPKDTYGVGEKFTGGKYWLTYKGKPFKGIILYGKSRRGFEDRAAYSRSAGTIETGSFDSNLSMLREALTAFKIDNVGFVTACDSFQEAGEYIFTISVYKCSDIGLQDDKCSANVSSDFILKSKPLKSVSRVITVVGASSKEEEITTPTVKTVVDCDSVKDSSCHQRFLDLFLENLKLCKPSKGTVPIGMEPLMGLFRSYEIMGMENNLCIVNFALLETPNLPATLSNKTMTCKYSNIERTIETVANGVNCSGLLYDQLNRIMRNFRH
jgi:hypothetical protein